MNRNNPTKPYRTMAAAAVLMVAMGVAAVVAKADVWNKKTILTVNQPIQVENTYLEPGTYVFKLLDSSSNRHVVQIFNRDEDHLINTVMAIPNYRLQPTGDSKFSFYETPQGYARAMRAWFYPGDNFGQEFRYPKDLRLLATAQVTHESTRTTEMTEKTETETVEETAKAEETAKVETPAETQITEQAEQKAEEQTRYEDRDLLAQAQPEPKPEAQPAPPPPAQETPAEQPTELPKTGTLFPLIGLAGLASLAGYGLLRMRRS